MTLFLYRCSAPAKSNDYQKIYADWCHEFQKYKSAVKLWEKKKAVSICEQILIYTNANKLLLHTDLRLIRPPSI